MATDDLRADVALANRIVHRAGLVTAFGHVSAASPGTDTFLFPTRASPALARADRLLVLSLDGERLSGDGEPNTELWIHARIYAAPDRRWRPWSTSIRPRASRSARRPPARPPAQLAAPCSPTASRNTTASA